MAVYQGKGLPSLKYREMNDHEIDFKKTKIPKYQCYHCGVRFYEVNKNGPCPSCDRNEGFYEPIQVDQNVNGIKISCIILSMVGIISFVVHLIL